MKDTIQYLIAFVFCLLFSLSGSAQAVSTDINSESERIIERRAVLSEKQSALFPNIRPYDPQTIINTAIDIEKSDNKQELQYIYDEYNYLLPVYKAAYGPEDTTLNPYRNDFQVLNYSDGYKSRYHRNKDPFLKYFYQTPAHFYQIDNKWFNLRFEPIAHFAYGNDGENTLFQNQRGAELRATIDNKVYVTTSIIESQSGFPSHVNRYIQDNKAIPHNGFYKNYNSSVLDISGYDYLNAQAAVGVGISKHISAQFGYSRHFIGHGIRSLFLSDFSDNYLNLVLRTQFKNFFYQNIYGELTATSARQARGDDLLPKKYFAAHYLGFKPMENMQIGLFESVAFSRNNDFEFHYLLPVILYRTVEGAIGSPDNVMLGLDFRWDLFRRISVYSQFTLDEFKFQEFFVERRQWWGNKYAVQAGIKYYDAFDIDKLDLQIEGNLIRPYIYAHRDSSSTFVHGNNPLAHPRGANLKELIIRANYRPFEKLNLNFTALFLDQGESTPENFVGDDPRIENTNRNGDFNQELLQGQLTTTNLYNLEASYRLLHDMHVYGQFQYRKYSSVTSEETSFFMLGFRWNIQNRGFLF